MNPPDLSRLLSLREDNDLAAATMELHRERFEGLRNRHANGTAPRAVSAFQLFQTPAPLAARMVTLAGIQPGMHVLEPSSGLGRIVDPLLAAGALVTVCEVSPDLSAELYRKYEGEAVTLMQRDFLTVSPDACFDRVVMNPPFHLRADIRHTMHALQFLKPGGTLTGLCLDTRHRHEALRPLSSTWEEIPAGTFAAEGTKVAGILFTIAAP